MSREMEEWADRAEGKDPELAKYLRERAEFLRSRGGPEFFTDPADQLRLTESPIEVLPTPVDLLAQNNELLRLARDPSTTEEREFEKFGFVFVPVDTLTLRQVIDGNPAYFRKGAIDYARSKPALRDSVLPRRILVAVVKSGEIFIPESFGRDRDAQLAIIQAYSSTDIETLHPDARAVMLPTTGIAQADMGYHKITGSVLIAKRSARATENIGRNKGNIQTACIGRLGPEDKLGIGGSHTQWRNSNVGALIAVVLTSKR